LSRSVHGVDIIDILVAGEDGDGRPLTEVLPVGIGGGFVGEGVECVLQKVSLSILHKRPKEREDADRKRGKKKGKTVKERCKEKERIAKLTCPSTPIVPPRTKSAEHVMNFIVSHPFSSKLL
jgi:hypothetical protein